jgi:hypothetical protein
MQLQASVLNSRKISLNHISVILVLFILAACDGGRADLTLAPGRFTVSNSRYHIEYELDRDETIVTGVLTMTGNQGGVREGGATKFIHYLSAESASDFKTNHGGGECPAPFFNEHAKQRILIPANTEIREKLSAIDFADYRDSPRWRPFSMSGYCIRRAPVVELDGKQASMPTNMFDNCLTMVVKEISVQKDI